MSSTAQRLIRNTGWLYAKMGITMVISLYSTRLILNGLGASDFGIFNIVGGAISMLGFLYAAMSAASQRFMNIAMGSGDENRIKKVFNVSVVLHIGIALFFAMVLFAAGFVFFNGVLNIPSNRTTAAIIVYASLIVSTSFTVMTVPYDAVMNAHENMKYFALIGILESLLKLSIAIGVGFTSSDRLIFYGILMACIPIINMCIMRIYCRRHYQECSTNLKQYFDRQIMKEMTGFAGWNFLTSASSMLGQYGMGIVINNFFGVLLNAAQGIANQVSGVLMTFSSNAMKALNPILVKSEGGQDRERVRYLTLFGCRISFIIISFFSLPMIVLAPTVLRLWLKTVPDCAVIFCQLQLVRIMMDQLTGSLGSAIYAQGDIKNYTIIKSILNIAPILITPIVFHYGGSPESLYYIWILFWNVLGGMVLIHYAKKLVGLQPLKYVKSVLLPALTAVAIFALPHIMTIHLEMGEMAKFWLCVGTTLLFCASAWMLLLEGSERSTLLSLASKKKTPKLSRNG